MKTVYLAGPIVGCTYNEANDWREYVAGRLHDLSNGHVQGVSPLRCEPLMGDRYTMGNPDPRFGTAKAIGSKNVFDVHNCDMILAHIPKPPEGQRHSWGTICELAGGYFLNKQVVTVSDCDIIHNHPVITAMSGWTLRTLDEGIEVIMGILGGYIPGGKNV